MNSFPAHALVLACGLTAGAWFVAYLLPAARRRLLDRFVSFLLAALVVSLLWFAHRRSADFRAFWALVAAGWTLNLTGNLVWAAVHLRTGHSLPPLSAVDALYAGRYMLLFVALWCFPQGMPAPRLLELAVVVLLGATVAWTLRSRQGSRRAVLAAYFAGRGIYAVLDSAILYAAAVRWLSASPPAVSPLFFLVLGLTAYTAANWISYLGQRASLAEPGNRAAFFWPLSDILTGTAAAWAAHLAL